MRILNIFLTLKHSHEEVLVGRNIKFSPELSETKLRT